MKVVILAGGKGTRIADSSISIPKPMIDIDGKPMICRIMDHYSNYGHKEFIIALGYKSKLIKEYFLNYNKINSDLKIDFVNDKISILNHKPLDYTVSLIETGIETLTGTRLKRLKKYLNNERFLLTYSDGISNVDIKKLIKFHEDKKKIVTLTAVRPSARFGELSLNNQIVSSFDEKPQLKNGYINGGFFVVDPEFFSFIPNKMCMLERDPMINLVKKKNLVAYIHKGFWHCVDTRRDLDSINYLYKSGKIQKYFK